MKEHRLKSYLKIGILIIVTSVFVIACQKDDTIIDEKQSIDNIVPTITTLTYEETDEKFNRLKTKFNIDSYLKPI